MLFLQFKCQHYLLGRVDKGIFRLIKIIYDGFKEQIAVGQTAYYYVVGLTGTSPE